MKLRISLLAIGALLAGLTARATVDDALSFALEAMTPYIKEGYTIREDTWGGDLPVATAKAISQQLFKGNDYWFTMGTDIKGAMRSRDELLAGAGCAPAEFDALLHILDADLRLITPTDPEGAEDTPARSASERLPSPALRAGQQYYQLTHDYLVPALREWLARRQRETRRGRAE